VASKEPTPAFATVALDLKIISPGETFGRIYQQRFPDPLGYGKTPSRFSDPSQRIEAHRYGVLYLGSSLKVCFLEAVLRDDRDGVVGDFPMEEVELTSRQYAEIEVKAALRLVDLTGDGPVRMGVPSDVPRASKQSLARKWSKAFHDHPTAADGIYYPSRLNGEVNLAIFDRALDKLALKAGRPLIRAPGLARVLDDLQVALV
jgi:hypothetical protein